MNKPHTHRLHLLLFTGMATLPLFAYHTSLLDATLLPRFLLSFNAIGSPSISSRADTRHTPS